MSEDLTECELDALNVPLNMVRLLEEIKRKVVNYDGDSFELDESFHQLMNYIFFSKLEEENNPFLAEAAMRVYDYLRAVCTFLPETYSLKMDPMVVDRYLHDHFRRPHLLNKMESRSKHLLSTLAAPTDRSLLIDHVRELLSLAHELDTYMGEHSMAFRVRSDVVAALSALQQRAKVICSRYDKVLLSGMCSYALQGKTWKDESGEPFQVLPEDGEILKVCYWIPLSN